MAKTYYGIKAVSNRNGGSFVKPNLFDNWESCNKEVKRLNDEDDEFAYEVQEFYIMKSLLKA